MKKVLLLICFGLPLLGIAQSRAKKKETPVVTTSNEQTVYVCTNGKTVVYHTSQNCSALRRCTHGVNQMKVSSAKASGLRACKKC